MTRIRIAHRFVKDFVGNTGKLCYISFLLLCGSERPMKEHPSTCSRFHYAIELVGRRWTGAILQALFRGQSRYGDIRATIPNLSDTMLTQRLRELEAEGVVARRVLATSPVRVEYHLTAKGLALAPVIDALIDWADSWIAPPADRASDRADAAQQGTPPAVPVHTAEGD